MFKPFRTDSSAKMRLLSWCVVLLLGTTLVPTSWSQEVNVTTEIPTTTLLPPTTLLPTTLAPLTSTLGASSSSAPVSTTVIAPTVAASTQASSTTSVPVSTTGAALNSSTTLSTAASTQASSTVVASTQAAPTTSAPVSTTQTASSSLNLVSTTTSAPTVAASILSTSLAPVSTSQAASSSSAPASTAASTQASSTTLAPVSSTTSASTEVASTNSAPASTSTTSTAESIPSSTATSGTTSSTASSTTSSTTSTSTSSPSTTPSTQTTPSTPSSQSPTGSQTVSTTPKPDVPSPLPRPVGPSTFEIINETIISNETTSSTSSSSTTTISTAISPLNIIISEPGLNITRNATKLRLYDQIIDFMPENIRNNGGILVHIFLLAYVCLALGIVCDIYFLSSLEFISNGLRLPSDIAGATFMAIGTSAPELFTSLIGVFISEDDIGTGTILGSAVFNVIFIPAVCGFAVWKWCETVPKVSKFSLLRDIIFYLITITTLLLALKDNEIDWIESVAMLGLFVIYLVIMYFNAQVGELLSTNDASSTTESTESTPLLNSQNAILLKKGGGNNSETDWEIEKGKYADEKRPRYGSVTEEGDVDDDNWVESSLALKILMFPALIVFKLTLPKPTKYCFILTFAISIVWISVLTYAAVWLVTIIGYTFSIPDTISGLTILAAGTSIPELISSVLVVKRAGLANMALCNTIGSNIFDILIGLGLPWFLKSLTIMLDLGTIDPNLTMVPVKSAGLPFTTFTLLVTVVALIATLSSFKWRLGLGVGITCTIVYVAFLVISSVFELWLN